MKTLTPVLALLLLFGGSIGADPRPREAIEADIAQVKAQRLKIERQIETRAREDARMKTARENCDSIDAIYRAYRTRLVKAQYAVNQAYREYKEQFRLSSMIGRGRGLRLFWGFCNTPYVGRLTNWKGWGPYAASFKKARNEFWTLRESFEAEKLKVRSELQHNTDLPSAGLGQFNDYHAFKQAYEQRKAYCDSVVRPYFRNRESVLDLRGRYDQLQTRLALLEEELAVRNGGEQRNTDGPHLRLLIPEAGDLSQVSLQSMTWGPKGLLFRVEVADTADVIEAGRLYHLVAGLGRRSFSVYGRATSSAEGGPPTLWFAAAVPARLGRFQLRLSMPDEPEIAGLSVNGTLAPKRDAHDNLKSAEAELQEAKSPRWPRTPEKTRKELCKAWRAVAMAHMRLDQMDASMRAAAQARALLEADWPTSRKWRKGWGSTVWWDLSWLLTQTAFERDDLPAVERTLLARAETYRQVEDLDSKRGAGRPSPESYTAVRTVYRRRCNAIVLLDNDLERARELWQTARKIHHPDETKKPGSPGYDPLWFDP